MYIEAVRPLNFRCFGLAGTEIVLQSDLTSFVGTNGSGKTAVMQALMRMFGVTSEQRRVRLEDFHVSRDEVERPTERRLSIEVRLAFPELADPENDTANAIPAFFHHMASDDNGTLKVRLILEATWVDDGSTEGEVESRLFAVSSFEETYEEEEIHNLSVSDRSRIQFIYIPAVRSASAQVTAFLRGRLWRAIAWSDELKATLEDAGSTINSVFGAERPISKISKAVSKRWGEVHAGGTDTTPIFRPVDLRLQEFVRKIEVVFFPDEKGRERNLEDLSDGQSSLFHIAMTTATLDIESQLLGGEVEGFQNDSIPLPSLTILALEEPENNLSPFYLSRIVEQVNDVAAGQNAQSLVSSHSASILARVNPEQVRHFRLDEETRSSIISSITLPSSTEEAGKYLREAVHAYPELYFAKFVILGEGASEEIILPRVASALGLPIDRSFVSIVPLGGRHVNHMWRLLNDLKIPHATLLDLDLGRHGGGWGRVKYVCSELMAIEKTEAQISGRTAQQADPLAFIASFDNGVLTEEGVASLQNWVTRLRQLSVYFSNPLDIDWSMLKRFPSQYRNLEEGMSGPSNRGAPKSVALGEEGSPEAYAEEDDDDFKWYRYLFLGRGKPSTHIRILGRLTDAEVSEHTPDVLRALIEAMRAHISPQQRPAEVGQSDATN